MLLTTDLAQEALIELLRDLNYTAFPNVKITILPNDVVAAPAMISSSGIYLHPCIGTNIADIKLYILHELYHPAVYRPNMEKFGPDIVNVAEDLHINYWLLKAHGMDVRKAPVPGIYDDKIGHLSPYAIAKKLTKKSTTINTWIHESRMYQPYLTDIADHIRTRWMGLPERHVMERTPENDKAFRKCLTTIGGLHPDLGKVVDPAVVLRGCFQHCFDQDPKYIADDFSPSAQLVVGMNPPRNGTIANDLFAEIAADIYTSNVSGWNCYAPQLVDAQHSRIYSLQEKLANEQDKKKPKASKISKLVARIDRAKKRLATLNQLAKISIPHELKNNPLVQYKRGAKAVSLMSHIEKDLVARQVPGVRNSCLKQVLALCSRPLRSIGRAESLYGAVDSMLDNILPKTPERVQQKQLAIEIPTNKILPKCLELVPKFDRAFQTRPMRLGDEENVETMLGFGQDLSELDASELALLSQTHTEQVFWQRYADHSLLQQCPVQSQYQPVYIAIDVSKSMRKYIDKAVSMALSLAKVLAQENRECTISTFNEEILSRMDLPNSSFYQVRRLFSVINEPVGGTSVLVAVNDAFSTRNRRNWKDTHVIVISDGDDVLDANAAHQVNLTRKPGDKLHLLLVKHCKQRPHGFDTVNYGDSVEALVKIAQLVL